MNDEKVAYLTSINIASKSAESIQTKSMVIAFKSKYNESFELYADRQYEIKESDVILLTKKIKIKSRVIRQLLVIFKFFIAKKKGKYTIFTREFLIFYFCQLFRVKAILEVHKVPKPLIMFLISKTLIEGSSKIIAISHGLKKQLNDIDSEIEVIVEHDGVDLSRWISEKEKKRKSSFTVTYTGSLYKGKDIYLINSAAQLFPQITFLIYGGKNEEIEFLKKTEEFKYTSNIIFKGSVCFDEIPAIQVESDILFFPLTKSNSLWNSTSPLKLFEYMASEVPIVASRIGTVTEILNEENSYLFDPDCKENLEFSLKSAIQDVINLNNEKAKRARKEVEYHTWDKRVSRIMLS